MLVALILVLTEVVDHQVLGHLITAKTQFSKYFLIEFYVYNNIRACYMVASVMILQIRHGESVILEELLDPFQASMANGKGWWEL